MTENFNLYSKYYDLLYRNKNYIEEVNYISTCIQTYAPETTTILEFGSGTGGHGLHLQEKGFDIYGLERSHDMVEKARLAGFNCEQGDITSFSLDKTFDAVISLFHVISYLTTNDELISTFKNAERHLKAGGVFIFDVWYTPAVYSLKPETRVKRVSNDQIEVTRIAEPVIHTSANVVDVNYSIFVKDLSDESYSELSEKHPMRHFSIPEVDLLAKLTGFEILKAEEFLSGNAPSGATWGVNFILKKNG